MKNLLIDLGLSKIDSFEEFFPYVRDTKDISVLKCNLSDIIILSSTDHIKESVYSEKETFTYWGVADRKTAVLKVIEDSERRANQFKRFIINKKWLDFGTGVGGILDLLGPYSSKFAAVEPQNVVRENLNSLGYLTYSDINEVNEEDYDVITLFHVLEHLKEPLNILNSIRSKMTSNGKIIIEVPHARDILFSEYDSNSFKEFTFWSEHLILHTKESLRRLLQVAGFKNITITGFQRYPLENHLHWLSKNKPGGHITWSHLGSNELNNAYQNKLASIDKTDTLIAIAEK